MTRKEMETHGVIGLILDDADVDSDSEVRDVEERIKGSRHRSRLFSLYRISL